MAGCNRAHRFSAAMSDRKGSSTRQPGSPPDRVSATWGTTDEVVRGGEGDEPCAQHDLRGVRRVSREFFLSDLASGTRGGTFHALEPVVQALVPCACTQPSYLPS